MSQLRSEPHFAGVQMHIIRQSLSGSAYHLNRQDRHKVRRETEVTRRSSDLPMVVAELEIEL